MARAFVFTAEVEDRESPRELVSLLDATLGIMALIDLSKLLIEAELRDEASIYFSFAWK